MKRPLLYVAIAYITGIILSNYARLEMAIAFMLVVLFLCLLYQSNRKSIIFSVIILVTFCVGNIYSYYKSSIKSSQVVNFLNKSVMLEGTFIETVKNKQNCISFVMKVHKINEVPIKHEKVRVNCYTGDLCKAKFSYGDLISVDGIVEMPDGQRNPGGFNYRRYLLTKNIHVIVSSKNDIKLMQPNGGYYSKIIKFSLFLKDRMIYIIEASLPQKQSALLQSILLSEKDSLDEEIEADFSDSGLTHLMAVSGLNVSFLVIPVMFILDKLKIVRVLSNTIITVILILFIMVTGSSPSVIRASIMALVVIYGKTINRQSDVLTSLSFSVLLILLYNPLIVFDIGFQLSYTATLSIVLLYSKIKSILSFLPNYLKNLISVTLSAQIGVIPIIMFYFNKISLISLFSNILAVPASGVILLLGLCMTILGQVHILFSSIFAGLNYFLLTYLLFIADKSSSIPFSSITVPTPSIYTIFIYYVVTFFVVLFWKDACHKIKINKTLLYKLGVCCGIFIITFMCLYKEPLEISFLDVGQGDTIVIKTPSNKVIMIDGGGYSDKDFNVGERIIVPFLLDKGINNIDIIVLSHTDSDHTSGLNAIIEKFNVKILIASKKVKNDVEKLFSITQNNGITFIPVKHNRKIEIEKDLFIEVFGAEEKYSAKNDNESLVLRLCYKNRKMLFAGDISSEVENYLIKNKNLTSDVLKVAHHGSKNSTGEEFLNIIKPKIAVISVGKNNVYGHPSKEVIDRLTQNNIKIFRTDKNGCISMCTNGEYIKIKTMNGEKMEL